MNQEYKTENEYEEINFTDYVKIIIKRKSLILVCLIVGLITAGGVTYFLLGDFKVETYLEIGSYNVENAHTTLIERIIQVREKINNGFYGDSSNMKTENLKETHLIRIGIVSKNPEVAKETLKNISGAVLEEHNQRVENRKESLESSIEKLEEKINFLLTRNKEVESLELMIVSAQRRIDDIQPTRIIKEAMVVSEKKTNIVFNLVGGGLLGLFLGVFLAFGKEWWKKNKYRI